MFGPGPLDLRWRMFGISVCIQVSFWIWWLILGLYIVGMSWRQLLLWIGVVLLSDLVHELGHAVVGRAFGVRISIVISGLGGGLSGFEGLRRWQRVLFFAAGPAATFALWGGLQAYHYRGHPDAWGPAVADWIRLAIYHARYLNLFIGFINVLPIFPLDGGMIFMEICQAVSRRFGLIFALLVSTLCAGGLAVYLAITYWPAIRQGGRANIFVILLFAFTVMNALQSLFMLIKAVRGLTAPTEAKEPDQPEHVEKQAAPEEDYDNFRPFDGGRYDDPPRR